jgi:hypothetical protein
VKLGVTPGGDGAGSGAWNASVAAWQRLRDANRVVPGQWRTNGASLESADTRLWLSFDRWADVTPGGFAVREWNQTGALRGMGGGV